METSTSKKQTIECFQSNYVWIGNLSSHIVLSNFGYGISGNKSIYLQFLKKKKLLAWDCAIDI